MRPDSGEILYDGRDLTSMDKHELNMLRREMGMLFQGSALFDSMTVLENVMFPLDMFSNDTYKDRLKRAQFCLDRVNLSEAGHLYPSEISGGMMTFIPVLVIFSMFTGILGGIAASHSTGTGMTPASFEYGLQFYFNEFYIWYSIIKSVVYAFIISSIAAYFGYNVKGGALEVGKASTNAVVMSSIMILLADVILTNLMLT